MRIAVLGNSHVACLKGAVDIANFETPELIFFAARGKKLRHLQHRDHVIYSDNEQVSRTLRFTSGGSESITVDQFDGFLIMGVDADRKLTQI